MILFKALAIAGTLAFAFTGALAASRAAPPGAVASASETIVTTEPDGTVITTMRPIKDIAAWFQSMGAPVPPLAPQASVCLDPSTVIGGGGGGGGGGDYNPPGGGDGGGGGGGAGNVPPAQDAATAATLMPPISVTADPNATSFSGGVGFGDGWSVVITWHRNPGNPPGDWFQTNQNWTPPGHGNGMGGTIQSDCDEEQE